ncbi:TldD/PmbA family protein [Myxococcus stipitatus DSM 14675]|uniref:TldD/PmbA family protein n=1 Tax=Myxococcus stipitatus (strain DSM 14675 / JCM 12634 / Mx s8) TaxID=1278073 RepID=L7U4I6_MYXSD|nr:metallopeptidase TldD-related protein [Myxococcus stipitatus]AGC43073.1 TldD/PmbA family protein [Myxococcus stipitatus DSM 14675]
MTPDALVAAARAALAEAGPELAGLEAELFLVREGSLALEHEASSNTFAARLGDTCSAVARVWNATVRGGASGPIGEGADLRRLLVQAAQRTVPSSSPPPVTPLPTDSRLPSWHWEPSVSEARSDAVRIARECVPEGIVVQALVLTRRFTWSALVRGHDVLAQVEQREEAFVRCETPRGAVVDAIGLRAGQTAWAALRERLHAAVDALSGPVREADPRLPRVLRPAVAAPLVAGLGWLLRGDVAVSTPALARAVGKKVFPSLLTVEDLPRHAEGTRQRDWDDEGRAAQALRLVEEGRLLGFLHSQESAARLGVPAHGRGLRDGAIEPGATSLNFFIAPRGATLPASYTELVARVETFTTMPRPGRVSLIAGGWEVRDGRRVHRIAPMELELPVLETFRSLRGVGADLTFFPTAEGCGTPTLLLPPATE